VNERYSLPNSVRAALALSFTSVGGTVALAEQPTYSYVDSVFVPPQVLGGESWKISRVCWKPLAPVIDTLSAERS
jgi:hypothetical protein